MCNDIRVKRVAQMLLILMSVTAFTFSKVHAATTATRTSAFAYDTSGLLIKEIIEPDNPILCLVTTYQYDDFGNKKEATTRNCNGSTSDGVTEAALPTGLAVFASRTSKTTYGPGSAVINSTTYSYSAGQFPTLSENALSHAESKIYDARFGAVISLTGPNNLTTTWSYDSFGRKTFETRADGNKTDWIYQYCSGVNGGTIACPQFGAYVVRTVPKNSSGSANGAVVRTFYDSLNREIRSEVQGLDGSLIYKDTQYDALGRVSRVSQPYYSVDPPAWTTYTYDAIGRPVTVIEAGVQTDTLYEGLVTTVTVSNFGTSNNMPEGVTQIRKTYKNSQGQVIKIVTQ